jgi:hypothetical protein
MTDKYTLRSSALCILSLCAYVERSICNILVFRQGDVLPLGLFINTHLSFTARPAVPLHYRQLRPLPEFLLVHLIFPFRNQQPRSVLDLAPTRRRTSYSPGFHPSQLKAQWSNSGVSRILSIQLESQAPVFRLTFRTHQRLRTREGRITPFRGVRK